MLDGLKPAERELLFRFLCAFAWVDGEVSDEERRFVRRLMAKVELTDAERLDVESWFLHAPESKSVDPAQIPAEHRRLFVDSMRALIFMVGLVTESERAYLEELKRALAT